MRDAEITMDMGWGGPSVGSAMILRKINGASGARPCPSTTTGAWPSTCPRTTASTPATSRPPPSTVSSSGSAATAPSSGPSPAPAAPGAPPTRWEWHTVSGAGAIYSYQIVVHSVLAGFRDWTPFPIVLVELDEQRGQPTPDDGLRFTSNLLDADLDPEKEENVAIGKRVHVDLRGPGQRPDHPPVPPLWRSDPGIPLEARDVTPGPRLLDNRGPGPFTSPPVH